MIVYRTAFLVTTLFALVVQGPTEALRAQGRPATRPTLRKDAVEDAVERGLSYLAKNQNKDGSWSANIGNPGFVRPGMAPKMTAVGDPAITALVVMSFLSAGQVPGEGPYGTSLQLGIRYVMNQQQKNGLFAAPNLGGVEMYYHGICTLMLAEVVGMMPGPDAEDLRKRLQVAVAIVLQAQRNTTNTDRGGWRYSINGTDSDMSVTGWQFLALRAAKNVGCDIPADRITSALEYVARCHDSKTGGYTYIVNGRVTEPCTGVGILCFELSGKDYHNTAENQRAGAYLLKNPIEARSPHFYYGVYYVSQAMFQLGDEYWRKYREFLHGLLLRDLSPNAEGAWGDRNLGDSRYGMAYSTAMAVLALTVEYRYLPIYQRFEEPLERDGD